MSHTHKISLHSQSQSDYKDHTAPRPVVADRPAPHILILLVTLFILPVALIPATKGGFIRIPPFPYAWWSVYFVILFGGTTLLLRVIGFSRQIKRSTMFGLVIPFVLLGGWQSLSLIWNGQGNYIREYSFLQSISMCSAIVGAVFVCSGLSYRSRIIFSSGITILVAFIILVYAGLSFVFPSFRPSTSWMDRSEVGLGFIRIFGPLGTATTLNMIILPALGFSLGMFFMRMHGRTIWMLLSMFFIGGIIVTGSRGGLISLATFVFVMLLWGRLRAAIIIVPFLTIILCVLAVVGLPERFRSLEDSARVQSYKTGLTAYTYDTPNLLLGCGHGSLYTKLHDDTERKRSGRDRWYLLDYQTQYGYSLRNSHSVILRSLVETGPLGLLLTLIPLIWLVFRPFSKCYKWANVQQSLQLRSALAGCISVIPYFFVEEFFISAFWVVVLWTMYAICASEGIDEAPSR